MKKPRRINWIIRSVEHANEAWIAVDENLISHGKVSREQNGSWFWTAWLAFCAGSAPRRRAAMVACEKSIMRNWPKEKDVL